MSTIVRKKTGRQRTLTFYSDISGFYTVFFSLALGIDAPGHASCTSDLLIQTLNGASAELKPYWDTVPPGGVVPSACSAVYQAGIQMRANTGRGGAGGDSGWVKLVNDTFTVQMPGGGDIACPGPQIDHQWSMTWSGSVTITIDVEEWEELETLFSGTDGNHSEAWAQYGGQAAISDMPPFSIKRYYEQGRIGGTITVSISVTDGTVNGGATGTTTITAGNVNGLRLSDTYYSYRIDGSLITALSAGNLAASHSWQGTSYNIPWSATVGRITHSTNNALSMAHASGTDTSTLSYSQMPYKQINVAGYLDTMDGIAYPDTIQITTQRVAGALQDLSCTGGTWSDTITQKQYSRGSSLGLSDSHNDMAPDHHQYIGSAALAARGEAATDWRILHRDRWYQVMTLRQAADYLLFSGAPVGEWTASRADLMQDGAEVKISVWNDPANPTEGSATWLPPAAKASWQNGRFLTIAVRVDLPAGVTDVPFRLRCGHKEWMHDYQGVPLAATGSATVFTIDTCIPTNTGGGVDSQESRWPTPTHPPSDYWGLVQVRTFYNDGTPPGFQLTHLQPGTTWHVGEIRLKILDKATATFLSPNGLLVPFQQQHANSYALRLLTSNVDGREPAIEEHCYLSDNPLTAPIDVEFTTIQQLADYLRASDEYGALKYLNLAVTPQVIDSVAEPVLNMDRFAVYCMGDGLRVTKEGAETIATRKRAIDLDILTADLTVWAQLLVDFVSFYPGCGDCIGFTNATTYGTPMELRPAKIMRSQGIGGLVTDQYTASPDGTPINCHEMPADSEAGSTTVAGGRGNYKTTLPFVRTGAFKQGKVYTDEQSALWPADTRYRHRRWMRAGVAFHGPWNLETPSGEYLRVAQTDDMIYAWSTHWSVPEPQWIAEQKLVAEGRNPRIAIDHRDIVSLVYERPTRGGYEIWETLSSDRGRSWFAYRQVMSAPEVATGKYPTIAVGLASQVKICACYNAGNIMACRQFPGDQDWSRPFALVDKNGNAIAVKEATFHLQEMSDGPLRWVLVCVMPNAKGDGTDTVEWISTDYCRTWNRGATLLQNAKYPTICHGQHSRGTIVAALVDVDGSGYHRLHGRFRQPGDQEYSNEFRLQLYFRIVPDVGRDLIVDEGSFHIQEGMDGQGRWVLTAAMSDHPREWFSTDYCRSWQEVVRSS